MASSVNGLTPRTILWEVLKEPIINGPSILYLDRTNTWMDPIVKHLRDGIVPNDEQEAARIKKTSDWFVWYGNNLYKKSYTHPLLKCITPDEGK